MAPAEWIRQGDGREAGVQALLDNAGAAARSQRALDGVADVLAGMLPVGSQLAVCWVQGDDAGGVSLSVGADATLAQRARGSLAGTVPSEGAGRVDDSWETSGLRVAIAARAPQPLSGRVRRTWLALARRTVGALLEQTLAEERIAALQASERLQQALYAIADLAGSDREMREMLGRIHGVVGALISADNFYIVLYDAGRDTVRFLYFADQRDGYVAEPDVEIGVAELDNSLTVALLRHGLPLRGPSNAIRAQLGVSRDLTHGPDAADWLGVPLRRDGEVGGAIVVQSYDVPDCYSDESRALLEFVAQHILTALDRRQAREQLERRVAERTVELQQANLVLQGEIVERHRAERLQRALYRIAELSMVSGSLVRFYADVHSIVGELLYARNFYVALLTADGDRIDFPYSVDERDAVRVTRRLKKGLTEYVLATGQALLADRAAIADLEATGGVRSQGAAAFCWLGVPLRRGDLVVGVIAVQSYAPEFAFAPRDQALLEFVGHHIDSALERKRAQDSLRSAHAALESRVEARTRELETANRELRAQIGERIRAEQRLTYQARHDSLTGLPNRVHLLDRLDVAIAQMADPARTPFAVLFLDLDRFKLVNDSAGHAAGDQMLIEAGRRIGSLLSDADVVARLGGDEFAVLVMHVESTGQAETLAAALLEALGQPMWIAGRELFPSASVGIALWQPGYRHGDELLRDADAAMYRAKAHGRDCSAVFDAAMRAESTRLLDLEADLRRAIIGNAFEPYFQPIVRLADGVVVGHEALLRWHHETRGLLSPGDFIGVGEDSGLIEQVDWLMYQHVFAWMARHREGYVSINVSPRHFRHEQFATRLLGLLEVSGADAMRLRIEITEGALLEDAPRALRMLSELRDHGVLALLDDFGTGFSALSYLHRFPIQALKIDQSFVAGLDGDAMGESLALVRAILALADTLGLDTIGEGIETPRQRELLRQLGCRCGQGFLLGRPAAESRNRAAGEVSAIQAPAAADRAAAARDVH